ncbi:MAG: hemerythrin domain-containing protein [Chloroflexota bacterium]|nr:hemerythrin domain-containing protein [Chloroflexota bacterium]
MTQHINDDTQARKPGEHLLQELKWVHNALRQDLVLCQELARQVTAGVAPDSVREQVKSLQTNSPLWKLRVNCLYCCRFVHAHHHSEDVALFPALRRTNPALGPVVDKLVADHRKISGLLDQIEVSAKALGEQDGTDPRARLVQALNDLSSDLLEHLAFEEEAIGPTLLEWDGWPFYA